MNRSYSNPGKLLNEELLGDWIKDHRPHSPSPDATAYANCFPNAADVKRHIEFYTELGYPQLGLVEWDDDQADDLDHLISTTPNVGIKVSVIRDDIFNLVLDQSFFKPQDHVHIDPWGGLTPKGEFPRIKAIELLVERDINSIVLHFCPWCRQKKGFLVEAGVRQGLPYTTPQRLLLHCYLEELCGSKYHINTNGYKGFATMSCVMLQKK